MTDAEICSRLLIGWNLETDTSKIEELNNDIKDEFVIRVIEKKLEWAGLDIKLNPFFKCILVICCQNNPAMVQFILSDILRSIRSRGIEITPGYEITSMDFSMTYPNEFPIKSIPHIDKEFEKKWDAQKINRMDPHRSWEPDNRVDTKHWWLDLVK